MFILSRLEENVRVEPKDLARPRETAISAVLERTLLDRVVHEVGLCVTLYDVLRVEAGVVYPNDGGVWFKVEFRPVIFRPFLGEILIAKVKKESKSGIELQTSSKKPSLHISDGLQLTLGFFEDIFVPEHFLPDPSFYDEQEGVWFWNYTNDEGETNQMYMEPEDDIRFKVTSVKFNTTPSQEEIKSYRDKDPLFGTEEKPFALMQVFGEISTTGLGPLTWWKGPDENDTAEIESK